MIATEYRATLRAFLIDFDSVNLLWEFTEESGNTQLDLYIGLALGSLNAIPPPISIYAIDDFPQPTLLVHAAALECLRSNSIYQARNDIQYNNSGISVKAKDGQRYNTQLQFLESIVNREIESFQKLKISLNIAAGWGGSWSPYATLNGRRPV